eukprot:gb/GECG01003433.1/.p1 GENE.gb/GECG01003433.1/~~gb/GECG01003433.1/.p1  ORF type:complete len:1699 (+),score=196.35 gb/GECG01003433.1/:1-5097(+)
MLNSLARPGEGSQSNGDQRGQNEYLNALCKHAAHYVNGKFSNQEDNDLAARFGAHSYQATGMEGGSSGHKYYFEPYARGKPWTPQVVSSEKLPLPNEALELCQNCEVDFRLGLLGEINRAYVVADNVLYIWNYEKAHENHVLHKEEGQAIRTVGLVVPKPHVFPRSVKYLLVVATPVEIRLLALTFDSNSIHNQLHYYDTGLVCQTDGIGITKIAGTATGRIFLVGDSGLVHELVYTSQRDYEISWTGLLGFSSRCSMVTHHASSPSAFFSSVVGSLVTPTHSELIDVVVDHHRCLLYTLSVDGKISGYTLGTNGNEFQRFAEVKNLAEESDAFLKRNRWQQVRELNRMYGLFERHKDRMSAVWPLVGLHVLPPYESRRIHVVAVSESGTRFYFTTGKGNLDFQPPSMSLASSKCNFGTSLSLAYIRLPPPTYEPSRHNEESTDPGKVSPDKVHHVSAVTGSVALTAYAATSEGGVDHVAASAFDFARHENVGAALPKGFDESVNEAYIEGKVYSIESIAPAPSLLKDVVYLPSGAVALPYGETAPEALYMASVQSDSPKEASRGLLSNFARFFVTAPSVGEKRRRDDGHGQPADVSGPRLGHEYDSPLEGLPKNLRSYFEHVMKRRAWAGRAPVSSCENNRDRRKGMGVAGNDQVGDTLSGSYGGGGSPVLLSALDRQHESESEHSFVCLTHVGLHYVTLNKPLNQLKQILNYNQGHISYASTHRRNRVHELNYLPNRRENSEDGNILGPIHLNNLKQFFRLFGPVESSAMLVAIGASANEEDLVRSAITSPSKERSPDHNVKKAAIEALLQFGGDPEQHGGYIQKSSRAEGISLYLSRLLRSFWKCSLFIHRSESRGNQSSWGSIECRFTADELKDVRKRLKGLEGFLKSFYGEINLVGRRSISHLYNETPQSSDILTLLPNESPMDVERKFIVALFTLLNRSAQAVSVMKVLVQNSKRLMKYLSLLDLKGRDVALEMTYETLICDDRGFTLARFLLDKLTETLRVSENDDNIDTEDMDDGDGEDSKSSFFRDLQSTLRTEAPDYFSLEDFEMWQAFISFDLARRSTLTTTASDRRSRLNDSLQHAINACQQWSLQRFLPQLHELCLGFVDLGFHEGVISLCCTAATHAAEGNVEAYSYDDLVAVDVLESKGLGKVQQMQNYGHKRSPAAAAEGTISLGNAGIYYNSNNTPKEGMNPSEVRLFVRIQCYAILLEMLESTLHEPHEDLVEQAKVDRQIEQGHWEKDSFQFSGHSQDSDNLLSFRFLLKRLLESKDRLLHEQLYKKLIELGLSDILVRCDGRYLEEFLKRKREYGDLLFEYYKAHSRYVDAACLQIGRAEEYFSEGANPSLEVRLSRYDSAISAASKKSELVSERIGKNTLDTWERRRTVARIQHELLRAVRYLMASEERNTDNYNELNRAETELERRLLSITELYYDYADKFGFFVPCLAILEFDNRPLNQDAVVNVWKRVINTAIEDTAGVRPQETIVDKKDDTIAELQKKVGEIGHRFWNDANARAVKSRFRNTSQAASSLQHSPDSRPLAVVPLNYLIEELESFAYKVVLPATGRKDYHAGWLCVDTLDTVGVSWLLRYEVYDECIKSSSGTQTLHYLESMASLLDAWIQTCHGATTDREEIEQLYSHCNKLIDDIKSRYKSTLRSFLQSGEWRPEDPDVKELVRTFESIQNSLQDFQDFAKDI